MVCTEIDRLSLTPGTRVEHLDLPAGLVYLIVESAGSGCRRAGFVERASKIPGIVQTFWATSTQQESPMSLRYSMRTYLQVPSTHTHCTESVRGFPCQKREVQIDIRHRTRIYSILRMSSECSVSTVYASLRIASLFQLQIGTRCHKLFVKSETPLAILWLTKFLP